jgi:hypothetical protein
MRSALFWDLTQRRLVISYRRFGKTRFIFKGQVCYLTFEDGTDRFSQNVGTKLQTYVT